jgi:hypothetical protein
VSEILIGKLDVLPSVEDFLAFKNCFIKNLNEYALKDERFCGSFKCEDNAAETISRNDWAIAIATGIL